MIAYFLFCVFALRVPTCPRPSSPLQVYTSAGAVAFRVQRPLAPGEAVCASDQQENENANAFLKIREMRTFRIFRFCPFDFCGKQVCKCLAFGRPHFIFRKIRTFRIFRFFWRALFFVENAAWSFAGAFPRWRGQIGVDPPSPRSDCP